MKELQTIQSRLQAPKNQRNNFGGYNYRSCEDILEAVKPLLAELHCTLTLADDIVYLGNRFYVKATATLRSETGTERSTSAYAREEDTKKGMDAAQITGSASSYARKYALNGLFCIDDNKDPDTAKPKRTEKPKPELTPTHPNWNKCVTYLRNGGTVDEMRGKYIISAEAEKRLIVEAENGR